MKNTVIKSNLKNFLSIFIAIFCVAGIMCSSLTAQAKTKSRGTITAIVTNRYDYRDYKHVYTNGKKAKLRVCTFNQSGRRTSGKLRYRIVSDNGACWSGKITGCGGSSSTNITLPKGNKHYKLYLWRDTQTNKNYTNTFYLSIDYMDNCY